jgi:4-hydroxy-3-polyprenylbenzoate decarboxylase
MKNGDLANLKIVVGISGASGSVYGLRLLQKLRESDRAETHLVVSRAAEKTLYFETGKMIPELRNLADFSYAHEDISARIASGSFRTDAMVVAPCSMHTMASIANGIGSNLIVRAADVALKERRKLILMIRETPFHLGHLRTMVSLTEMGAIIAPPIPAFYQRPQTIDDLVNHTVERVLDLLGIPDPGAKRWDGPERSH